MDLLTWFGPTLTSIASVLLLSALMMQRRLHAHARAVRDETLQGLEKAKQELRDEYEQWVEMGQTIVSDADTTLRQLTSERMRALALIRHNKPDDTGSEDDPNSFLLNMAAGAGLDLAKLQAGDHGEWAKARQLLDRQQGQQQQPAAQTTISGALL